MERTKNWIRAYKWYVICALIISGGLCGEFYLFQYGFLKCLRYLVLLTGLWIIAWIDKREKRIPNKILLWMSGIRAFILLVECIVYTKYWGTILLNFTGAAFVAGGMFLFCYLLSRGGMGAGDVKLLTVVGFYVGLGTIFTDIFLTVCVAAFYTVIFLILKKIKMKEEISFAPFVLVGTVLTMALGM